MTQEKASFPKLDGTNYGAWKFKAKMYLVQKGLWGSVDGSSDDPVEDGKALAVIGLSVTNDQIVHIMECKTS